MNSQDGDQLSDLFGQPHDLEPSDQEFLRRLDRLARRRAVTRAARREAMANLLAHTTAEAAMAYLGLDLDELRQEPS